MTISAAGFGYQINLEDGEAPPGHALSFKRCRNHWRWTFHQNVVSRMGLRVGTRQED